MTFNKFWIGLVAGIMLPVFAFGVFYVYSFNSLALNDFFLVIQRMDIFTQTLTFCILPSFLLFFIFYWKQYNRAAQGAVLATMLMTIGLVIWNF